MAGARRPGRINVKLLGILVAGVVLLGAAAVSARYVRKRVIADRGLAAGNAAFERQDWAAACEGLKRYLERYPDNADLLEKFAQAHLHVRPIEPENIGAAIGAYRRLLRLDPTRASTYESLAELYAGSRDFDELAYVARKRREQVPDDPKATIWSATARLAQRKPGEARSELENLVGQLEKRPDRCDEYVVACSMLSDIASRGESAAERAEALTWLDRAVAYDPQSVAALIQRARFHRLNAAQSEMDQEDHLASARQNLEAADDLQTASPPERLLLFREWLEHDEFGRASSELQMVEALGEAALKEVFLDLDEWLVVRFVLKAELLLRTGAVPEGCELTDKVLATLEHKQHRTRVLPLATRLYALADRVADARRCFEEFRDATALNASRPNSDQTIARLEALLAYAEDKPYCVIELLEPLLDHDSADSHMLKMLVDAYAQTNQDRRASAVLERYLAGRDRSSDQEAIVRLARAQIAAGNWAKAARLMDSVDADDVDGALVDIEARLGNLIHRGSDSDEGGLQTLAAELARLSESNPRRVDIRVLQATVETTRNRTDAAEDVLEGAIHECTDSLPAKLMLARLYLQTQRTDQALETCRDACDGDDDNAAPWLTLAAIHESLGQETEARATLTEGLDAIQDRSAKREIAVELAVFDLLHDARQAGIDRLETLAAEDPTEVAVRSLLLDQPETVADAEAAGRLIEELRGIEGETGLLWRAHQASLWMSGDQWRSKRQEVQRLLEFCVDADPGWHIPALLLGELHARLGELDQAEKAYERALAVNAAAAGVADRLLALLQGQRRFADAGRVLDRLEESVRIAPQRRVEILVRAGEVDKAIEELKLKVAADARDTGSRVALAQLLYRHTRNATLALKYLDEAEAASDRSLATTFVRALILRSEGRRDEARQLLDLAVDRAQTFDAYFLRAQFLSSVGESALAEEDCIRLTAFEDRPEGHVLLGLLYADTQRPDEAIAAWERGLTEYPDGVELRRRLMTALLGRDRPNDRERGQRLLAELEKEHPDDPELLWVRATLALDDAEVATGEAESLLGQVVERRPTAVDAHLQLIQLALQRGDDVSARDLAARALDANPDESRLLLARAEVERRLGNPDAAGSLVKQTLARDPRNAAALHSLAQIALGSGAAKTLAETQKRLEHALEHGAAEPLLRIDLALVLEARGQSERVETILENLRQDASRQDFVTALLALSKLNRNQQKPTSAASRLEQATALAPDDPRVLLARVELSCEQGKLEEVVELMRGDRPNPPYTPEVLVVSGAALASSGNPAYQPVVFDLFEDVSRQLPSQSPLWFDMAGALYRSGAADRAMGVYREVLAKDPQNPRALNDLAWILAEARQAYDQALPLAERGLELTPDDVHLLDTRGVILSHLPGRLEDARRDFERCVELCNPGSPARARALLQLARVSARLDDRSATRRCLRGALEIDQRHNVLTAQEREDIAVLQAQTGAD